MFANWGPQKAPPPADPDYTSMYTPDPLIDEFAHTRPPDDLFDDDFVPLEPEPDIPSNPAPVIDHPQPTSNAETAPQPPPLQSKAPIDAPRGPKRPGGPPQRRGVNPAPAIVAAPIAPIESPSQEKAVASAEQPLAQQQPAQQQQSAPGEQGEEEESAAAPTAPARKEAPVRGDRSGTGGVRKAKLTEEELSAKLEAMKIKNAALVAAHEASLADAESFEAREAIASQRRREEGVKRRELLGEREKNRIRKLKAQGVREWDVGKEEREGDEKGFRKGMHGGVVGERPPRDHPRMEEREDGQRDGGRREHRGGRGGRRGGHREPPSQAQQQQQQVKESSPQAPPKAEDFPELPLSSGTKGDSKKPAKLDFPQKKADGKTSTPKDGTGDLEPISLVPAKEKRSWADQVESP
jgi:hypothetical protein